MNRIEKTHEILMQVVKVFNPNYVDDRTMYNVWSRQFVAKTLLDEGHLVTRVGEAMGKDHSTVSHYKKAYNDLYAYCTEYRTRMDEMKACYEATKDMDIQTIIVNDVLKTFSSEELARELLRRMNKTD